MTAFLVGLLAALTTTALAVNERLAHLSAWWLLLLAGLFLAGLVVACSLWRVTAPPADPPAADTEDPPLGRPPGDWGWEGIEWDWDAA